MTPTSLPRRTTTGRGAGTNEVRLLPICRHLVAGPRDILVMELYKTYVSGSLLMLSKGDGNTWTLSEIHPKFLRWRKTVRVVNPLVRVIVKFGYVDHKFKSIPDVCIATGLDGHEFKLSPEKTKGRFVLDLDYIRGASWVLDCMIGKEKDRNGYYIDMPRYKEKV